MNRARKALLIFFLVNFSSIVAAEELASGEWASASFFTTLKGDWKIVRNEDGTFVEFARNFKTSKAPDLKILLSSLPADQITPDNAVDKSHARFVSLLTSYSGAASYKLPAGVTLGGVKSLIIHCEQYTKLWGAVPVNLP